MKVYYYLKCEKGATALEYVLIASGIALTIVAGVYAFGGDLALLFDDLGEAASGAPQ